MITRAEYKEAPQSVRDKVLDEVMDTGTCPFCQGEILGCDVSQTQVLIYCRECEHRFGVL